MAISDDQQKEIDAQRARTAPTRRATVAALEEALFTAVPVLDHGFVRVVDYMGDDAAVVQAARVSYGTGTKKVSDDRGLIRYLMRHAHTTPFEMCEIKLHMKLPIFVARQVVRHRTANINEYSARYSVLDNEFYCPPPDVLGVQDARNRQGRGRVMSPEKAATIIATLKDDAARAYTHYEEFLGLAASATPDEEPLARELARINLPVSFYTQWYWKTDLHNLFHFLHLRMDAHAQHEVRAYADAVAGLVARWVPQCWEAFLDYRGQALRLSRIEIEVVRKLLAGQPATAEAAALSRREREELAAKLGIDPGKLGLGV